MCGIYNRSYVAYLTAGQPAAVGDYRVYGTHLRFLHRPTAAAAAEPGLWVGLRAPCPEPRVYMKCLDLF
jgi:hypothetical protein